MEATKRSYQAVRCRRRCHSDSNTLRPADIGNHPSSHSLPDIHHLSPSYERKLTSGDVRSWAQWEMCSTRWSLSIYIIYSFWISDKRFATCFNILNHLSEYFNIGFKPFEINAFTFSKSTERISKYFNTNKENDEPINLKSLTNQLIFKRHLLSPSIVWLG